MPIAVACPSCKSKMQAPDKLAGKKVKCPKCGASILVGKATAEEAVGIDANVLAGLAVGTADGEGEPLQDELAQLPAHIPGATDKPPFAAPQTACPHCRLPVAFNADVAGKHVICPHCKETFPMPAAIPEQQALVDLLQRDVKRILALLEALAGKGPNPPYLRPNPWSICVGIWLFALTSGLVGFAIFALWWAATHKA